MATTPLATCPRCASRVIQPPDTDGEYDCVTCGERWPDPAELARKQARMDAGIAAVAVPRDAPPLRRGRPPVSVRIIRALEVKPQGMTVSEIARYTGTKRHIIEREAWTLSVERRIVEAEGRKPLTWRLAS